MVKDNRINHPADALARALDRASNLLGTMGDLYNPGAETFSGGNTFVVHALTTASTLIAEARSALDDLHYSCDLTILEQPHTRDVVMEMATMAAAPQSAMDQPDKQAGANLDVPEDYSAQTAAPKFTQTPVAGGIERYDSIAEEPFAQSYLELLRKLTAAEVFAAEQQALSVPGTSPELLPLLRSLREDLQKIHSAA